MNALMKAFDPAKPCRTRSGRPARVTITTAPGKFSIVAFVTVAPGTEVAHTFDTEGKYNPSQGDSPLDLINC